MIISFSGHRPVKLGGWRIPNPTYNHVCDKLRELLLQLKPTKAISGMALGFDSWAAEICIELEIPFLAAVPFAGQESRWPEEAQENYRQLLSQAAEIVTVSTGGYTADKMQVRNCWMVDHCEAMIIAFDGSPGGTYNCVKYAQECGRIIHLINPREL